MITINDLSLQYGEKHIFKKISARIHGQDHIGLVGVNGTGKSTLLKILAGESETDPGVITIPKGDRETIIGYLPQEIAPVKPGRSLVDEARQAFRHLLAKQQELDEIYQKMSELAPNSEEVNSLLERQGELQQALDQGQIFTMDAQIEKVLMGLGFTADDMDKDCQEFSGGWLMRLMLAKQLLVAPPYLLLDEPTNHLDMETLTWLEEFLKEYHGALVIISHDRAFLDNLTSSTWELSLGRLTIYKGNYSHYVHDKEERLTILKAAYDNQQAKIDQTMRFVERFRAKSTKAKQAQSRLKQLEKMDLIELEDSESQVHFRFPPAPASGRLAVELAGVSKSFADLTVYKELNLELNRGDKLAVVGVNGAGKSTLVKMLAGLHQPDRGEIKFGHNVITSYFGQHQAQELLPNYTVLETMNMIDVDKDMTQVRSLLGAFLFRGEEVDKKVAVLSGGEKSRLALAKMIATPANFLIMDEPTNHLDISSQEILMAALNQFDGTIIVVSHNRYFLDNFTNKTLEIKEGRGVVYDGNISYYLAKKDKEGGKASPGPQSKPDPAPQEAKKKSKQQRQQEARTRQELSRRTTPLKREIKAREKEIETLERQKETLEQAMADPDLYQDQDAFTAKSNEYGKMERQLERAYKAWEEAQEEMERLNNS
ncbi:MAG: ribosomal protection-like ABC-F family protein [Thermodesulfobacteriota bacterium]